jgi:hypothetical protein
MRPFALFGLFGLGLLSCSAATIAQPAKKASPPAEPPMQVHVVRSAHAGCEPQCLQWIAAQGKIDGASLGQFRKVLGQLGNRKLPVLIDSSGGSVNDALAIGRLMRAKGLDVVVTRTVFDPCAPTDMACRKSKTGGDLRGLAQARQSKCASSCAFILAGGARRFVGQGAYVGVHQITMILHRYWIQTRRSSFGVPVETRKTLLSTEKMGPQSPQTQRTYGDIKRYFAEMGIGAEIMALIMSTPGDKIRWLRADELKSVGLATHPFNGEELITGAPTSKAAAPPVAKTTGQTGVCMRLGEWTVGCEQKGTPAPVPLYLPPDFAPSTAQPQIQK